MSRISSVLLRGSLGVAFAAALLTQGARAQVFIDNTIDIPTSGPANNSTSENVDFGDVDLDGDWDAVFADGGDGGNDQNRIWINQGGLQGGSVGTFVDNTTTRFPQIQQTGRDIEFVDIDDDGDLDIYTSNTSQVVIQSNRWWVNQGGVQSGTLGFYTDDISRWVGLGGPGSSLASSSVLGSGGFIDWSCDCDFGDLDNDGDMDLVHSSYGGAFGGEVPTRLFLNDGSGFFSEFNPSGFTLTGNDIQNGDPGLWCEGLQSANTVNSTGQFCDIASSALDIDVGDIDGDFDLDILHGAREERPRMFQNRLAENGGSTLGFRDVTGSAFPSGYSTGNGHYEQEMADMDGDGDLDIYGLNWLASFGFTDITLRNTGNGVFDDLTSLQNSSSDDNEGDFIDYDLDGDLDLYVANFVGADKLYRNNNNGGTSFSFTDVTAGNVPPFVQFSPTSLDADVADVDNDGDYDVIMAADTNDRNVLLSNTTNPASGMDNHAPVIPNVEQASDRTSGADPTVIRAQVYDNAPYYITWYNTTRIDYTINGGAVQSVAMKSSGGQIFRGELPGGLVGNICYTIVSEDQYGQVGSSAQLCFNAQADTGFVSVCNGDGGNQAGCTNCPCGNNAPQGTVGGCLNPSGTAANLLASGNPSVSSDTLRFELSGGEPTSFGILSSGNTLAPAGAANPCFGLNSGITSPALDGLRCAVQSVQRHGTRAIDTNGDVGVTTNGWGAPSGPPGGLINQGGFTAGQTRHYQVIYRVIPTQGCGTGQNTTQAVTVTFQP